SVGQLLGLLHPGGVDGEGLARRHRVGKCRGEVAGSLRHRGQGRPVDVLLAARAGYVRIELALHPHGAAVGQAAIDVGAGAASAGANGLGRRGVLASRLHAQALPGQVGQQHLPDVSQRR
nr:hypothetical protein [Tanacetum cinerariifolium]